MLYTLLPHNEMEFGWFTEQVDRCDPTLILCALKEERARFHKHELPRVDTSSLVHDPLRVQSDVIEI